MLRFAEGPSEVGVELGWTVNAKCVQRIWRAEGLKVPKRQPKRGRPWLADGSCIRLCPERPNHVWTYDFVAEKTPDGRTLKLLCVVDEYSHGCLAIRVARRMTARDVLWVLADLFLEYGIPEHIRSDNGPEFVAAAIRDWLADLGVTTLFIEPGSPWENGYVQYRPTAQGAKRRAGSVEVEVQRLTVYPASCGRIRWMLEQRVRSCQGRIISFSCFSCVSACVGVAAGAGGSVTGVTLISVSSVPWSSTVAGLQPPTTRQWSASGPSQI